MSGPTAHVGLAPAPHPHPDGQWHRIASARGTLACVRVADATRLRRGYTLEWRVAAACERRGDGRIPAAGGTAAGRRRNRREAVERGRAVVEAARRPTTPRRPQSAPAAAPAGDADAGAASAGASAASAHFSVRRRPHGPQRPRRAPSVPRRLGVIFWWQRRRRVGRASSSLTKTRFTRARAALPPKWTSTLRPAHAFSFAVGVLNGAAPRKHGRGQRFHSVRADELHLALFCEASPTEAAWS